VSSERIVVAETPERIERVRDLFREYADATGHCECFQGFAVEVEGLPGEYAPPGGQLLLAEVDSQPAGYVALRKLDNDACEMKRLYVRPEFRGRKLGRHLAETMIAAAGTLGYRTMRLDTLSTMTAARSLYQSLGFRPIQRYNDNLSEGVVYLELGLDKIPI
jgi:ribosomal protein S18 acetylase RimI-like enzyme